MKNLSLITICLALLFTPTIFINAQQQQLQLEWAGSIAGTTDTDEFAYGLTVDNNDNVIITGWTRNTTSLDFDFGAGSTILNPSGTSNDIFLSKYNTLGIYQWAFTLGGAGDEIAYDVTTDNAGNIYMIGEFEGTVDFDPSGATANLTQVGSFSDFFMASYDANGNYRWAFNIATNAGFQWGDIEFDGTNIVVGGDFRGNNVDFNPGAPTFFMTPTGQEDMFIAKYTTAGNFVKAVQMGDSGDNVTLYGLGLDASGNVYITGQFGGTLDMDPTAGVTNLTTISFGGSGRDWFLGKYDSNLNLVWANSFGGGQNLGSGNQGRDVVTDASGNVYVTGIFHDVCDFDPSGATQNLTTSSNADEDFFVAKYNSSGNYVWAFSVGLDATAGCTSSGDDRAYRMDIDGNNNILISGIFKGWTAIAGCEANFDPLGTGNNQASNNLSEDGFFAVYDQNGINQAMYAIGTSNNAEQARSVGFDNNGDIYVTGYYQSSNGNLLDMDPTANNFDLAVVGFNNDMFVAKYKMLPLLVCNPPVITQPSSFCTTDGATNLVVDSSGGVWSGTGITNTTLGTFNPTTAGIGSHQIIYTISGTSCDGADTINVVVSNCVASAEFCLALSDATSNQEEGTEIAATSDGGFIAVGYTKTVTGGEDIYIIKTDASGNVMWEKTLGGNGADRGKDIIQTTDGGYALTGYSDSNGAGNWDVYVVKLDASGNVTWTRTVGNTRGDVGYAIEQTTDGGYIIGGEIRGDVVNINLTEMYLVKLDAAGAVQWTRTVGDNAGSFDSGRDVIQTTDGGYMLVGFTRSYGPGSYNVYMAKFDGSGTLQWTKVVGGSGNDQGNSVVQTSDGGYAVAGQTTSFTVSGSGQDAYVLKVNSIGTLQWTLSFGANSGHYNYAESIIENASGELVFVGRKYNVAENMYKVFITGVNSSGAVQWSQESIANGSSFGVTETSTGGYGIAGSYSGVGAILSTDFFILSTSATGTSCCMQATTYVTGTGGTETTGGVQGTGGAAGAGGAVTNMTGTQTFDCGITVVCTPPVLDFSLNGSLNPSTYIACPGETLVFDVSNIVLNGAASGSFDVGSCGGTPSFPLVSNTITILPTAPTYPNNIQTYCLRATGGCLTADTCNCVTVTVMDPTITQPAAFCTTDAATNLVSGTSGGVWTGTGITNASLGTFNPATAGQGIHQIIYTVTGTTCSGADTINVVVNNCTPVTNFNFSAACIAYGTDEIDIPTTMLQLNDGGFILGGSTFKLTDLAHTRELFTRTDANGNVVWVQNIGTSNLDDALFDMVLLPDGNIAAVGYTHSSGAGNRDIVVNKINVATGANIWSKTYGGTSTDEAFGITVTPDGNIVVAGGTSSFGAGNFDGYLLKIDQSTGNVIWDKTLGGTAFDELLEITTAANGDLLVVGYTMSFGAGSQDMYVARINPSTGVIIWDYTYGGTQNDRAITITESTTGDIYIAGITTSYSVSAGDYSIYALKLSSTGVFISGRTLETQNTNIGLPTGNMSIIETASSEVVLSGVFGTTPNFKNYIVKLDNNLNFVSALTTDRNTTIASTLSPPVINTNSNDVAYLGLSDEGATQKEDYFLVKLDNTFSSCCTTPLTPINASQTTTRAALVMTEGSGVTSNFLGGVGYIGFANVSFNLNCPNVFASFTTSTDTVCLGDSITFTDNSPGGAISWTWTFTGGVPATANTQGPHTVGFSTAGSHNITLQVGDGTNTDDTTFTIVVIAPSTSVDVQTACNSYTWIDGVTYTSSNNTAIDTIFGGSASGCDSIVTLNLTINLPVTSIDVQTACNSYTWIDGVTYTTSNNTAQDTVFGGAANTCDSIITLNLTITPNDTATFTYPQTAYCLTDVDPLPIGIVTSGGGFTIDNSGTIDAVTGLLDITTSGQGNFIVTYTTVGACPDTATFNIAINSSFDATITQPSAFCPNDAAVNLNAVDAGGLWSGTGITDVNLGTFDPATAGSGTHEIIYTIVGTCGDADTINIVVNQPDTATFTYPQTAYCLTDTDPLPVGIVTSGGGFTIDNSGTIDAVTGLLDITTSGQGNFIVTYITAGTCPDTATFNIAINSGFDATITQPSAFCANDAAVNLNAVDGGGLWSGTGITDVNLGTFDPATAGAGTHQIIYTITGTCGDADTINVIVNAVDIATFVYGATFCLADANPLPTGIVTTGGSFTIDNSGTINATTGEIDIIASGLGNFTIKYVTAGLCPDSTTQTIAINACLIPIGSITASDTAICETECVDFTDTSVGGIIWTWTFPGGNPATSTDQNPTVCYNTSGSYIAELIVSNNNGSDTVYQTIEVTATPTIIASSTVSINLGESTTLTASGSGGTYTWSPTDWLSCVICQTTLATPEETTTYTVTLDSNGCTASDEVTVIVNFENIVFVPNIFSPNGDGNNDILFVEGKTIDILEFFIYDRWGEKVFETINKSKGWNGDFRGKPMNKAVFVYYLRATFRDGSSTTKKGDITLIR